MNYISQNIFIGSLESAQNYKLLLDNNIKTIIRITSSKPSYNDTSLYDQLGIKLYYIQLDDSPNANIIQYFDNSNSIILENIPRGNILIHCHAGISRSVTIAAAFFLYYYIVLNHIYPSVDEIIFNIRIRRSIVNPNVGFRYQLEVYRSSLIPFLTG
jgi:protein-tyrosine phosphatase